jgi:FixJ family two-component response regulator
MPLVWDKSAITQIPGHGMNVPMTESGALVAIVDDEESIRKALVRLLRLAEFEAIAFTSASDLLESLAVQTPDCVILDLHMPGMTGVELLRRFASLEHAPPVIVITASDESRTREECFALGVKRYLRKPIDRTALMESVRSAIDASWS